MEALLYVVLFAVLVGGSYATGWCLSWAQDRWKKGKS